MSNLYSKLMATFGCEHGGIGSRSSCSHNCCDSENCVIWFERQFRRLAAYESSGLSPEEVQKLKKSDASKEQCTIDQHGEIHRLRDELKRYKQAEQEGRLVELPPDGQIYHIERIEKTGETWVGNKPCRYITTDGYYCGWGLAVICFPFSELGKTVFLTREEAEKALGRCSHEHNHQRRKITP